MAYFLRLRPEIEPSQARQEGAAQQVEEVEDDAAGGTEKVEGSAVKYKMRTEEDAAKKRDRGVLIWFHGLGQHAEKWSHLQQWPGMWLRRPLELRAPAGLHAVHVRGVVQERRHERDVAEARRGHHERLVHALQPGARDHACVRVRAEPRPILYRKPRSITSH